MGINKVILIGNVGKDPDVQYIREDVPVAKFTLATSETYKDKNGQKVTNTEWHNIVIWRGLAKVVEQYVKKGDQLYIEGKITTRSYEKDGNTQYFTEIVGNNMQMLGKSNNQQSSSPEPQQKQAAPQEAQIKVEQTAANDEPLDLEGNDDLPF